MKEEPRQIAERASDVGEQRLDRGNLDILITSFIGGAEVSLGGLAAITVVGSACTRPSPWVAWPSPSAFCS